MKIRRGLYLVEIPNLANPSAPAERRALPKAFQVAFVLRHYSDKGRLQIRVSSIDRAGNPTRDLEPVVVGLGGADGMTLAAALEALA